MIAHFVRSQKQSDDIYTFFFKPQAQFRYVAGQFVEIELPTQQPDERGTKRWFTLSSSPTEELLAITTRLSSDHSTTFKQSLRQLTAGAKVTISEPMGDFVLPKDAVLPLVFVAGGIGITPVRSMVRWLNDSKQTRRIELLYFVRTESDAIFIDEFEQQGLTLHLCVDVRPDFQTLQKLVANIGQQTIYISGPEKMVDSLAAQCKTNNIPGSHIVIDSFPGY
ncbi:MAG TPA: FAD-dependent oxidoreductase [Candidatus Saccharibacteria bacterium]|nr:FAD-dependent oxidoreductase [Candidatus Saccharibacteria bacterium]